MRALVASCEGDVHKVCRQLFYLVYIENDMQKNLSLWCAATFFVQGRLSWSRGDKAGRIPSDRPAVRVSRAGVSILEMQMRRRKVA